MIRGRFSSLCRAQIHRITRVRFIRFLLVGVLNTAFGYAVYAAFLFVGLPYAAASLCALAVGVVFSFKTSQKLVFGTSSKWAFARYVSFWLCVYLLNILFIKLFISFGFDAYVAGLFALGPVTVLSYLGQRFLVFAASASQSSSTRHRVWRPRA